MISRQSTNKRKKMDDEPQGNYTEFELRKNSGQKGTKFGVQSSNSLKRAKLSWERRDPREFISKTTLQGASPNSKHSAIDDGEMQAGVLYSLNKKKRWEIPDQVKKKTEEGFSSSDDETKRSHVISYSNRSRMNRWTRSKLENAAKSHNNPPSDTQSDPGAPTSSRKKKKRNLKGRSKQQEEEVTKSGQEEHLKKINYSEDFYSVEWAPKKNDKRIYDQDVSSSAAIFLSLLTSFGCVL